MDRQHVISFGGNISAPGFATIPVSFLLSITRWPHPILSLAWTNSLHNLTSQDVRWQLYAFYRPHFLVVVFRLSKWKLALIFIQNALINKDKNMNDQETENIKPTRGEWRSHLPLTRKIITNPLHITQYSDAMKIVN